MPAVIAAIYLLLALRVRISLEGSLCGAAGSLALSAGAAGVYIRFDGVISRKEEGVFLVLTPRYAAARRRQEKEKHIKSLRVVRTYLWFARTGRMEYLAAHVRLGLGDAGETAVATGFVRALAFAALRHLGRGAQVNLHVAPDFDGTSFTAHVRCVFSCQPGDMMLAAVRFFLKKKSRRVGRKTDSHHE